MSQSASYTPSADGVPSAEDEATVRDYVTLLKPGVMALVVFTGAIGMWMSDTTLHPFLQMITILCISLGSGAGGAINMWYDYDIDALMKRTAKRPIPRGVIPRSDALTFGIILSIGAVGILGLATNWIAAALLGFAIWFYAYFYTMLLKRRTPQNIVIGGAAGAFPPMIGWLAMSPELSWDPILYFAIIFLWTPPHFWALALYRSDDYAKAHIPMMPVVCGVETTKRQIVAYSIILFLVSLLPSIIGVSGVIYLVAASVLGINFLKLSIDVYRSDEPKVAMGLFKFSILYLFMLFTALLADKIIDKFI